MQCFQPNRVEDCEIELATSQPQQKYGRYGEDPNCQCQGQECGPEEYARLPPQSREHDGRKTLVLDLDETLVHSSFKPVSHYDFTIMVEVEGKLCTVYVIKRPGVDRFLQAMSRIFEVMVFTASLRKYADPLLDILDPNNTIKYRRYRESCRQMEGGLVKDLTMLGRDLSKTIIIDNSPHSYMLQPNNAIPIGSFIDDMRDRQLLDLVPDLEEIAKMENPDTTRSFNRQSRYPVP
jgi:RNA polymerase II subunit A small phosphatase-like protein